MLSSICLHGRLRDSPVLAAFDTEHGFVLGESMVVTCMRAGLYQTKKGCWFTRIVAVQESHDLGGDFLVHVVGVVSRVTGLDLCTSGSSPCHRRSGTKAQAVAGSGR